MTVPAEPTYKNRKDYKIIGKRTKGVDNANVVTGKPVFGLDIDKPGMVIAQIIRPPFGATLKSFEATDALKMPGIVDVISFKNKVAIVGQSTWQVMQARAAVSCKYDGQNLESESTHKNGLMREWPRTKRRCNAKMAISKRRLPKRPKW